MIDNAQVEKIQDELFKDPSLNVYAVIDGAAVKDLRFKLWEMQPEHCCLWAGKLEPDMEEVAPYLILLPRFTEITNWLVEQIEQYSCGIYVRTKNTMPDVRKQLRKFLMVSDEQKNIMLFRFYDPRVFSEFMKIMDESQKKQFVSNGMEYVLTNKNGFFERMS